MLYNPVCVLYSLMLKRQDNANFVVMFSPIVLLDLCVR